METLHTPVMFTRVITCAVLELTCVIPRPSPSRVTNLIAAMRVRGGTNGLWFEHRRQATPQAARTRQAHLVLLRFLRFFGLRLGLIFNSALGNAKERGHRVFKMFSRVFAGLIFALQPNSSHIKSSTLFRYIDSL